MTRTGEKGRVLIIGLDGATFDLINPWVAEGKLPTFRRLMSEGVWGELQVEIPPGSVPNWPTFSTGKNPGKHGLIWWVKPEDDDYAVISSADLRSQTFWDIAGRQGVQVGIVNVPVTYPPQPVNGFLISGLLTPPGATNFTYPPTLRQELLSEVGEYHVFPPVFRREGNEQAYLDALHHTLETRLQTACHLLQHKPWQLFTVVFGATDWVMHAFWRHHDSEHPYHQPALAARYRHAIRSIYEHVDRALARLLALTDEQTTILIMSDHGAGPSWGTSLLNNWLLQIGLLKLKRTPLTQLKYLAWRLGLTPATLYPWASRLRLVNARTKRLLDPSRKGSKSLIRRLFLSHNDVDWTRTKAYSMGGMGQLYVNVRGRNLHGAVEPGKEYEAVRRHIVERLPEIRLPHTGRPFAGRILRGEDLFHGQHQERMPDILVVPSDMRYMDSGMEFASNRLFTSFSSITGSHRPNGIILLYGANIRVGQQLENVSIRDIAPTTLHLLGLPTPDDMDGRVITEAFDDQFMAGHPLKTVAAEGKTTERRHGFDSSDEEQQVRERLANLGYLN